MTRTVLPSKFQGEGINVTFNFIGSLTPTETIAGKSCTSTVYSGTDSSPAAIIAGSASSSGAIVTQKIVAGVVGVIYEILCTITTSANQTLQQSAFLAVVPDLL